MRYCIYDTGEGIRQMIYTVPVDDKKGYWSCIKIDNEIGFLKKAYSLTKEEVIEWHRTNGHDEIVFYIESNEMVNEVINDFTDLGDIFNIEKVYVCEICQD